MLLHKVQPGPVPEYRFFCLSARDTVCPIRCDVEILMAPDGKPSCLTTLPAVRHCQSHVSLPTRRRTCSRMGKFCLGNWWFEESTPPPTLHEDSLMYGLRGNRAREKTPLTPDPLRRSSFGCTTLDSRRGYGHGAPKEGPVGTLPQPAGLGKLGVA